MRLPRPVDSAPTCHDTPTWKTSHRLMSGAPLATRSSVPSAWESSLGEEEQPAHPILRPPLLAYPDEQQDGGDVKQPLPSQTSLLSCLSHSSTGNPP